MSFFNQPSQQPSTSLFSFGTTPTTTSTSSTLATGLSTLATTTTAAPATGLPLTTTLGSTTVPASGTTTNNNNITFKQLEEYINGWMRDLDDQEKEFLEQACQLNGLDRIMIDNGEKIIDLNNEVDRLNREQDKLEQELDFIMTQQSYLEQSLNKLETNLEQIPILQGGTSGGSYGDKDRVYTYQLLLQIDNQLKTMSNDLKEIIQRLNKTQLINLNDPSIQISKILNAHMDSLNWIEDNSLLIQKQIDLLGKQLDDAKQTHASSLNASNATFNLSSQAYDRTNFNYY